MTSCRTWSSCLHTWYPNAPHQLVICGPRSFVICGQPRVLYFEIQPTGLWFHQITRLKMPPKSNNHALAVMRQGVNALATNPVPNSSWTDDENAQIQAVAKTLFSADDHYKSWACSFRKRSLRTFGADQRISGVRKDSASHRCSVELILAQNDGGSRCGD